ncbi:hypothetical protein [Conexibacter sp. SYSU D00693]|uniref:hypothetical protein n=1 Tax=Conexibacter sp. SYSU D00693 TaxID=2812560 RepID=UPI00196B69F4|nr:hypothetical protein [Conexibacter sp. SYSU D00693]
MRGPLLACALLLTAPSAAVAGWAAPVSVGGPGQDVLDGAIASGAGRTAITWTTSGADGGERHQWLALGTTSGSVGAPIDLGVARGSGRVAVDGLTGAVVVAWTTWWDEVRVAAVPAGGTSPGPDVALGTVEADEVWHSSSAPATDAPLAVTAAAGRLSVAWRSRSSDRIVIARGAAPGAGQAPKLDGPTPVSTALGSSEVPPELVATALPDGGALLAWTGAGDGHDAVRLEAAAVPASGTPGTVEPIGDPARAATGISLDADALGRAVLTFVDGQADWFTGDVAAAFRPAQGPFGAVQPTGSPTGATLAPGAANPGTHVDVSPDGRVLAGWPSVSGPTENSFGGAPPAFARGTTASGVLDPPATVGGVDYADDDVVVAVDQQGTGVVASDSGWWQGAVAARVDASGATNAAALVCPATVAHAIGAVQPASGQPLVLWRQRHPRRAQRSLFLSRGDTSADVAPCSRTTGAIVATPTAAPIGTSVQFDATAALDPELPEAEVSWRFVAPDETATEWTPWAPSRRHRHTFTVPGWHRVEVALDSEGRSEHWTAANGGVFVCEPSGCPVGFVGTPWSSWRPPTPPPQRVARRAVVRKPGLQLPSVVTRGDLAKTGLRFALRLPRADRATATLKLPGAGTLGTAQVKAVRGTTQVRLALTKAGKTRLRRSSRRVLRVDVHTKGGVRLGRSLRLKG